jgi:EAL domain-containing protein (putative c-di-GMP-specific phosphodiesterase class I)/HAMP domain-containing protein
VITVATWGLFMDREFGVGDWQILTWQPNKFESFSPGHFLRANVPTFALGLITVLFLTLIVLRRSLAPIRGLTDFAEQLTKGNLRARIDLNTGDEIERLGNSFNQMASQLERHFKALEDTAAIDHAILAAFDGRQIIAQILRHVFDPVQGGAFAVALNVGGEISYGLKTTTVESFELVLDADQFAALCRSAGSSELSRESPWAPAPWQVYRLRGDIFAILCPELPSEEGAAIIRIRVLAEMVQTTLAAPLTVNEASLRLSASLGAALYPRDAADGETLLKHAESAVRQAKTAVINQRFRFYSEDLNTRAAQALVLRNELRKAIEDRAFVLHYQPKIEAKTSRVIGCEALIRWQHPARGLVMPGDFIIEAEQSGLIIEIGQIVLEKACQQLRQWRDCHAIENFKMSVNLAARQFEAPDLDASVANCLRDAGVPAHAIELEITETVACADMARTIEYMERLRAIGLSLALDDFGTGHSSLRYLQRMPIQAIKIDRSFVIEIGQGPKGEAVIESILTLCRCLGMQSVAEGVETAEQYEYLRERACDVIQGYFFSRPLAAEAFEAFLIRDLAQESRDFALPRRAVA